MLYRVIYCSPVSLARKKFHLGVILSELWEVLTTFDMWDITALGKSWLPSHICYGFPGGWVFLKQPASRMAVLTVSLEDWVHTTQEQAKKCCQLHREFLLPNKENQKGCGVQWFHSVVILTFPWISHSSTVFYCGPFIKSLKSNFLNL